MKSKSRRESNRPTDNRRAHRARPTPKWLLEQQDLDEMARRRCLMVLSVLSGERPVTDVVVEAGISRGLYYQLEEKALRAMLRALAPGNSVDTSGAPGADGMLRRMSELEEQLKTLQQEKRRAERMLFLTRKVVKAGPVAAAGRGRPPRARTPSSSAKHGASASTSSPTPATSLEQSKSEPPSTRTPDGATTP